MQLFYYSHVIGAVVFMVFGMMHHSHTWTYAAAGLVIYGIDLAFRVWQTSLPVTVDIESGAGGKIINIRIPVKVRLGAVAPCSKACMPRWRTRALWEGGVGLCRWCL